MKNKKIVNVLLYNLKPLIVFQILYKLLLIVILVPLFIGALNFTMFITGYKYVTLENIYSFLFHPITFFVLVLILVIFSILSFFDVSTMLIIFDKSYHKKKITLVDSIKVSLYKCGNCLKVKNVLLPIFIFILIPFLNVGNLSNLFGSIQIPGFIEAFIERKYTLLSILVFSYIIVSVFLFNGIYSIHYMILEDKDLNEAIVASKKLIKGYFCKDLFKVILSQLLLSFSYSLFVVLDILILYFFHVVLGNEIIELVFVKSDWYFINIYVFNF